MMGSTNGKLLQVLHKAVIEVSVSSLRSPKSSM